jgi:hypothetical protein
MKINEAKLANTIIKPGPVWRTGEPCASHKPSQF